MILMSYIYRIIAIVIQSYNITVISYNTVVNGVIA